MAPSGWGQVLARARACPPVLEVDVPISPSGGDPFPESHSPHRQWLPSNNITRILIAFCYFSGFFLTRKHTHFMAEMLFFHACELFETDKWCTPASTPKIWTPMTAVFRLSTTHFTFKWLQHKYDQALDRTSSAHALNVFLVRYNKQNNKENKTRKYVGFPNTNLRICIKSNYYYFRYCIGMFWSRKKDTCLYSGIIY